MTYESKPDTALINLPYRDKLPQIAANEFVPSGGVITGDAAAGAQKLDGVALESGSMLTAGALLTQEKRVKKDELYAGRPVNLLRRIDEIEATRQRNNVENYLKRPRNYLDLRYSGTENA